jgi:hypothetical protein
MAALVACKASVTLSLISPTSTSLAPPIWNFFFKYYYLNDLIIDEENSPNIRNILG